MVLGIIFGSEPSINPRDVTTTSNPKAKYRFRLPPMRLASKIITILSLTVIIGSLFIFASAFTPAFKNDKELIYRIFYFLLLFYIFAYCFFLFKAYKTKRRAYSNVSTILAVVYVSFVLYSRQQFLWFYLY
jgi:drug/metabolite transporter (DMT)-like permease